MRKTLEISEELFKVSRLYGRANRARRVHNRSKSPGMLIVLQVGVRFRNVCDKLDRFKGVFAVFPSDTIYTSVLCGSLSLIVNAAVAHNDIADFLSEAVADIADKASHAAGVLVIYPWHSTLRQLFAGLYAHVFLFYRDTIEWFTESKFIRGFKSFDSGMKEHYQKAKARIDDCLGEIFRVTGVAFKAETSLNHEVLSEKIDQMREQLLDVSDQVVAGRAAQRNLQIMIESAYMERPVDHPRILGRTSVQKSKMLDVAHGSLNRSDARASSVALKRFVIGTEGPSLFVDGQLWLPEVDISFRLGEWINPDTQSSTLWISSPISAPNMSSSRAAALIAALAAWDSGLPVISHFCERPHSSKAPNQRKPEEVGLIGVVYNLIMQLLHFNVKEDTFHTSQERLKQLDGSNQSWSDALLLLQELLRATPQLQRCIIDNLNELCFGDGIDWCSALLKTLFEHQKASMHRFKILLTTTGYSRVLPDYVRLEDQVEMQRGARELVRGGEWLTAAGRQDS